MSDDLIERDDITRDYGARRDQMKRQSALQSLLQRTDALPPGGEAAPPTPIQPEQAQPEKPSSVRSVVGDVVQGIIESPRQAFGGVADAITEVTNTMDDLAGWLNENVLDLSYEIDIPGIPNDQTVNATPQELIRALTPDVDDPKSATGGGVRSIAQFITGFVAAGSTLKAAGVPAATSTGGKVATAAAKGAMADAAAFDPTEERLSNIVQEFPSLQNPVTEYLAAGPEDSRAEGRIKNALEGLGLGMATDGFLLTLRGLRGVRRAKQAGDPLEASREQYGEVTPDALKGLGDPEQPVLKQAESGEIEINFARIDTEDDVKALLGDLANRRASEIDEARRGVQSFEETKALADDLGMTVEDVLSRRKGQPFNAEEALAARRLWTASAEKLIGLAKTANGPGASDTDRFLFRKMLATHYAIQAEVIGARTETARALSAWRIPAGGGVEQARAIENLLAGHGGGRTADQLAAKLSILAESGASMESINTYVRKGWKAASFDAVREVWVNGLLSAPQTHIVNMSSNLGVIIGQIYERGAATQVSRATGSNAVAPGEMGAMTYGLVTSLKDAFVMGAKALRTGQTGASMGKIDLPMKAAIHGDFLRESGHNGAAAAVDFIGEAFRVPGRLLGAEDEFFKTIGYRMELHAQAVRQATSEGLKGPELAERMRQIIADPPEHIRIASADAALYNTFTNTPGDFGKSLLKMREAAPPVSFILPFLKTPINIARYAFERSPIAPLVGQWRADIAAGGARADIARARMATGTTIMMIAADYADSGFITGNGPDDPGEREALMRQGWRPYSLKLGDKYVEYNRMDPFGMTVGFAADMAEVVRRKDIEPEEMDEVMEVFAAGIAAVSRVTVSKTYMQGVAGFLEAVNDSERYGEQYLNNFIGSFVPSGAAAVERAIDPIARETERTADYLQSRIAGLSERLPPRRDLWGKPITAESGMGTAYDVLAPARVSKRVESPIDAEMQRLNLYVTRARKKTSFNGVDVDLSDYPKIFDDYVRLAGNDLPDPAFGMGAKDYLDAVVSGKHAMSSVYQMLTDGEDGGKAKFIQDTVNRYRNNAKAAILTDPDYADFAEQIDRLKYDKAMGRF